MKIIVKSKSETRSSKLLKVTTGLAVGVGIAMCISPYVESELLAALIGGVSTAATFALV